MVISSLYSTLQVQSTFIYMCAGYQHSQHHFLKWEDRSTSDIPRWHSDRNESFWLPVQYYPWHYLSLHFIHSIKITGDWKMHPLPIYMVPLLEHSVWSAIVITTLDQNPVMTSLKFRNKQSPWGWWFGFKKNNRKEYTIWNKSFWIFLFIFMVSQKVINYRSALVSVNCFKFC